VKPRVIILDIDGTLTSEISWQTLTRELGASVERELDIYENMLRGRLTYAKAKHQVVQLWQATGHANRTFITGIFERLPLDPAAGLLVEWLKGRDAIICLISGSVDLFVETIARRLGVSNYYANTELVFDPSGQLTDFHYETDQAGKKLTQLKDFCHRHNLKPTDCIVIGDGESELGLFRATGRGILLDRPEHSAELRVAAWKTITNLTEIQALLDI
jgi:phosphoserine phosphatase